MRAVTSSMCGVRPKASIRTSTPACEAFWLGRQSTAGITPSTAGTLTLANSISTIAIACLEARLTTCHSAASNRGSDATEVIVRCNDGLGAMSDATAVDPLDRERLNIDALQAPNVHRPSVEGFRSVVELMRRGIAGTTKRENSTDRTEVVLRGHGTPLVQRQRFPRCEQAQRLLWHSKIQSATPTADGAIAQPHMIDLRVHLEADAGAVAGTCVRGHGA